MGNQAEWHDLLGCQVQVQQDGHTVWTGHVEAVSMAADALWIAANGVKPGALYEKAQGQPNLPVLEQAGAGRERQD
jgi:hypothetical protein